MSIVLCTLIVTLYRLAVLGGTAYLVGWHGWSGWWFLLAVCVLGEFRFKAGKDSAKEVA